MSTKAALYQISDIDYLKRAWRSINRRNLRSRGLDDVTIQGFKSGLDDNLRQISMDLRAKKYAFRNSDHTQWRNQVPRRKGHYGLLQCAIAWL